MLASIIIAVLSAVANAQLLDDAVHLSPRQTVEVDKSDPCFSKVSSAGSGQPTPPPVYLSWASSMQATMSDNCTAIEITGAPLTAIRSWEEELREWRTSHKAEFKSIETECSSYLSSSAEAFQALRSSHQESCRAKSSSTRSTGATLGRSSASTTGSSSDTSATTTSTTSTTITTKASTDSTTETTTAAATSTTDSMASRGIFSMGCSGLLVVALNLVHLL